MSKTRETFTTPIGRLVSGDAFTPQEKDQQGNPRVFKSGPKAGQPNPQYYIGVAFPKMLQNPQTGQMDQNHEFNAFYGLLERVARTEWPALFPNPNGPCVNPLFAFKVKDGDGVDRNGKSNATKEGWAGHWVVSFASAYAPKLVRPAGGNIWEAITDKAMLKRGFYVRVAGSVTSNDSPQTPGLFLNLDMVELAGHGVEIVSGPDAATAFGQASATPIPGMTALPQIGAGLPNPGAAPMSPPPPVAPIVPLAQAPVATVSPVAALPASAAPVDPSQPYTGFMAPGVPLAAPAPVAVSPSLPAPPPPPPLAPVATPSLSRAMTAAAGGQPYETFIAAGWTDDMLTQHGYMTA